MASSRKRNCRYRSACVTVSVVGYAVCLCTLFIALVSDSHDANHFDALQSVLSGDDDPALEFINGAVDLPANGSSSCADLTALGAPRSVAASGCYHNDEDCQLITCQALFHGNNRTAVAARQFMNKHRAPARTEADIQQLAGNCSELQRHGGYAMNPLRPADEKFPIAFTLLVHWHADQFERLLRVIYRPQNVYCIHVDAKASNEFRSAVTAVVDCFPNVFLASQLESVVYTGFSRLQADINCMKDHLAQQVKWHYLLNIAGQSYPLRTPEEMVDILQIYNGANDIEGIHGKRRFLQRFQKEWMENQTVGLKQTGQTNPPPPHDLDIVRGSAYGVFSRKFVEFLLTDHRAKDFLAWSRHTYSPDEHYWATLHHTYINPHLHTPGGYSGKPDDKPFLAVYVKWSTNRDKCSGRWVRWICVLGVGDLPDLLPRREFFVNKFDVDYDWLAVECAEAWLRRRARCHVAADDVFYASSRNFLDFYRNLSFVVAHHVRLTTSSTAR